ncbi:unannotated protein [freshwater metagenome]|uniref:Unannotated protein n=1 Tax=freshwater metagenome TaxID=449393 RepID=A0A6J7KPW6_9ZZZZ|nr:hypothetical protein [Actinomycetota bacterium]
MSAGAGPPTPADSTRDARSAPALAFLGAASITLWIVATLVAVGFGWLLRIPFGPWALVIGALIQVAYIVWIARRTGTSARLATIAVLGVWALAAVMTIAIAQFPDTTTDGRHYQGESVRAIASGWNPIWDPPIPDRPQTPNTYTNSYAKGVWAPEAIVLRLTNDIEATKVVPLLIAIGALLAAFAAFSKIGVPMIPSTLIAVGLAANPIATSQVTSHMVDGAIGSAMLLTIALTILALADTRLRLIILPALAASIVLLVNIKLTAPPLSAIVVGAACLTAVLLRVRGSRLVLAVASIAATFGVVFVGANPYLTNTLRHGNPFYPAIGGHRDLLGNYIVGAMVGRPSPVRALISISSQSGRTPLPKVPFSISMKEISIFKVGQPAFGGLGPLFSGALVMTLIAAIIFIVTRRRVHTRPAMAWVTFAAACGTVISVLVNPASFVARFAPELWLVVGLVAAVCFIPGEQRSLRMIGAVCCAILLVNAALVAAPSLAGQYLKGKTQQTSLRNLAESGPWTAEFTTWPIADIHMLRENGVSFVRVTEVQCDSPMVFTVDGRLLQPSTGRGSGVLLCPAKPHDR